MKNKTQLHLKTINFQDNHTPYSRLSCQSSLKTRRSIITNKSRQTYSAKLPIKMSSQPKRFSMQTQPSKASEEFILRFQELQINRRSLRIFANTTKTPLGPVGQSGQFPKRESQHKNNNAFKYFLNSSIGKIPPSTEPNFLDEFYKKIAAAITQQASKSALIIEKKIRAITEPSLLQGKTQRTRRPIRPHSSFKQVKAKPKPSQNKLQPWQISNAEDNLFSVSDL